MHSKWQEMHSKVIFGHPKWSPAAILWFKKKVAYWSEMARNVIESDFRSSKMAASSLIFPCSKKNIFWLRIIPLRNFTKTNMDLDSVTQNTSDISKFQIATVTNLGCVRGQYHTNNEQTQSVEGIIWFNWFLQRGYSQLHNADEYRWLYTHFT